MDKKTLALIGGIVVVVAVIVIFQQYVQPNGSNPKLTPIIGKITPSAPTPSPTSKPLSYSTITIPNQEGEKEFAANSAEAFLITLSESNWAKQYDRLLHDELKSEITKDEYVGFWEKNLSPNPIKIATVARVDFIKEYKLGSKKFANVAVIQPEFLKSDRTVYTNPVLDFIYLAKDGEGNWKLLWDKK